MKIEYEAKFIEVNKDEIRSKLKAVGARLVRPEYLQKRIVLDLPVGLQNKANFIRVRDEGDKVTLTHKISDAANKITSQRENMVVVNDFDTTVEIMKGVGCIPVAYEESKRELWILDDTEVTIDHWPFLDPYVEVEGNSEEQVKAVSEKLGFVWSTAKFSAAGMVYVEKYGFGPMDIARRTGKLARITFDGENVFLT